MALKGHIEFEVAILVIRCCDLRPCLGPSLMRISLVLYPQTHLRVMVTEPRERDSHVL